MLKYIFVFLILIYNTVYINACDHNCKNVGTYKDKTIFVCSSNHVQPNQYNINVNVNVNLPSFDKYEPDNLNAIKNFINENSNEITKYNSNMVNSTSNNITTHSPSSSHSSSHSLTPSSVYSSNSVPVYTPTPSTISSPTPSTISSPSPSTISSPTPSTISSPTPSKNLRGGNEVITNNDVETIDNKNKTVEEKMEENNKKHVDNNNTKDVIIIVLVSIISVLVLISIVFTVLHYIKRRKNKVIDDVNVKEIKNNKKTPTPPAPSVSPPKKMKAPKMNASKPLHRIIKKRKNITNLPPVEEKKIENPMKIVKDISQTKTSQLGQGLMMLEE